MYALASTTCSVLRGTTTNQWGDVVDDPNGSTVATGIPVAITVTSTRPYDATTQQIRTIRTISGSIQSDTDIRETDRLRDDTTGVVYAVESVTQHMGPGFTADLELVLTQVS
jgi:hypothetical protein